MMPEKHRALLTAHCERCHDAKTQKGKFRVDDLPFAVDTVEAAERWQKVLNVLNAGEMPPEGEKLLAAREKADFLDDLANVLVAARKGLSDQHGAITMRRLNRREYRNTLRELLGVEINVAELPADTGTGGFDTVGSNPVLVQPEMEDALARRRPSIAPSHLGKQLAVLSMVTLLPMSCIGTALYLNLDHTIPDADQRIRGGRDGGALDRKDLRWPGDGSAEMPEPICGMIADEFLHRGIEGHRHAKKCNR